MIEFKPVSKNEWHNKHRDFKGVDNDGTKRMTFNEQGKTVSRPVVVVPDWVYKYKVDDCDSVEEFAHKYRKPSRFTEKGQQYVDTIIETHKSELKRHGFTIISKHDNVTGDIVAFIPNSQNQ